VGGISEVPEAADDALILGDIKDKRFVGAARGKILAVYVGLRRGIAVQHAM
jgi:hypothetical protein